MGIGIGAKNATVPIYSAEMAPARIRGALVMFWQLWVVAGELPLFLCARLEMLYCYANRRPQVSFWASLPT
jgi:Sugar (and other) transporter